MKVTGGHDTRVSLAALIAVRPGHRPRLIYRTHRARRGDKRKGFTETDYARFLDAAHQQLGGPLVLVWDGLNTHTSRAMREMIAARDWLTVYRLPPYAPELNPVEPIWSNLKRSLANLVKHDIDQLTALVKTRLRRMQYQPGIVDDDHDFVSPSNDLQLWKLLRSSPVLARKPSRRPGRYCICRSRVLISAVS